MSVEIITKEDLQRFRLQLLNNLKALFFPSVPSEKREWLRSSEIKKILQVWKKPYN
jgi:hypothetical protein